MLTTRSVSHRDSKRSRRDPTTPLRHLDPVIVLATLALAVIGMVAVWSATRGPGPVFRDSFLLRQGAFVAVGVVAMAVFTLVDYHKLHDWAWLFYAGTCALLLLVLTPLGTGGASKGAQAWFNLGPFQLQPAEFAKLSLIGALAFMLSEFKGDIGIRRLIALLAVAGFPMALIMLQPDLGQVLTLLAITLAVLLVGGLPAKYIVACTIIGVIGVVGVLNSSVLADYQLDRLSAFANPGDTTNRAVYNIEQSQRAIASGEITGYGLFEGPQTRLGYVPEQETDFIFTAVAEQFGFVGGATVLGLYAVLCYRIFRTAQIARDLFGTLVCIGVLAMFVFSLFQNVGMAMGIMPVTGIPLLLISSGGSSAITAFAAIGLVLNVHMRRFR
jgi:rod shape determining protein RodA